MAGSRLLAQGITRRRALLRFISAYVKKNDLGPSRQEMAQQLGVSKSAVTHHLKVLRAQGYVTWDQRYRSVRVITDAPYPPRLL